MPKVRSASSGSHSRPSPGEYSSREIRWHTKPPTSLRRNQACKQCRKRKSILFKQNLKPLAAMLDTPAKRVSPECSYDGDYSSRRSSPAQLTPSPVQSHSEPPTTQSSVLTQSEATPPSTYGDSPVFSPLPWPDWPIVSPPLDSSECLAPWIHGLTYTPDESLVSYDHYPYLPPFFLQTPSPHQLFAAEATQPIDASTEWLYCNTQSALLGQYHDTEALQLI
ncbi:multidrug resistance regulator 1 [Ceratobasidium sp. AG-Ba]|nr:multidrug resistance regulator 1 [Ceratobasidium sp. AG-Ba]